jgi:hypothetical protein
VIALFLVSLLAATSYGELLERYVLDDRWVDYTAWRASAEDHAALQEYIDRLSGEDLFALEQEAQIAAWINLYNAVTVDLILDHEPVGSIKELDDPWSARRVTVAGRDLSLDDIEHEILRKDFDEPRIHFALNCASVSCPPLSATPFTAEELDEQLDQRTLRTLSDPEWLDAGGCPGAYGSGVIRVTKLFAWFADDFGGEAGIRAFLQRYRPDLRFTVANTGCKLESIRYDWSLNAPPEN